MKLRRIMLAVVLGVGSWIEAGQAPAVAGHERCAPEYPDFCIPNFEVFGDINCPEVRYGKFAVLEPDPHDLDKPDNDGIGCENNPGTAPQSESLVALTAAHGVSPQVSTTPLGAVGDTGPAHGVSPQMSTTPLENVGAAAAVTAPTIPPAGAAPTTSTTRSVTATTATTARPLVNTGSQSGPTALGGLGLLLVGVLLARLAWDQRVNGAYRVRGGRVLRP